MFNILRNCSIIKSDSPEKLIMEGFGIHHLRTGKEQIIPSIYSNKHYYSFIFNHDQVPITIDGNAADLPANTLVLWDLSHVVKYGAKKLHWSISWVQVNGEVIKSLIEQHQIPLNHPVCFGNERLINNYWMPLLEELNEYSQADSTMLSHHITGILLEIKRNVLHLKTHDYSIPRKFLESRTFLDNNYRQKITLNELAEKLHIAPIYFSRKFKEYFGLSPIDYVIMLRLHEATLCLANEEMSIAEIAESVSYHDSFHFSKLFKRHYGVSPQKFRNDLLNSKHLHF